MWNGCRGLLLDKTEQQQNHIQHVKIDTSRGDYARLASSSTHAIFGAANTIRSGTTTSSTTKLWRYSGVNYVNGDHYGYRASARELYDYIFRLFSTVFDYAKATAM